MLNADNSIKPHLKQIDELDGNIAKLEQLVQHLDVYSRRLEAQFKQIYRN